MTKYYHIYYNLGENRVPLGITIKPELAEYIKDQMEKDGEVTVEFEEYEMPKSCAFDLFKDAPLLMWVKACHAGMVLSEELELIEKKTN